MKFSEYAEKTAEEVLKDLKTSENGLSEKEAENRLKIYGQNETNSKGVSLIDIFLRQFKSPFFYLLFIAAFVSVSVGEKNNGLLILLFVFINVVLGFIQEHKAEKAIFLLKKYVSSTVRVLREKTEKIIDKKFLVPGDIVLLELGNIAPADLRIIKAQNLLVDESVLTGESVPVFKISRPIPKKTEEIFEAKNIIFAGTSVISGEAEGVVVATGPKTVSGGLVKLISEIKRSGAYEKDLLRFSRLILRIVITTILLVFLGNLIIKGPQNFFDFLVFSIALIVSAVPEALPLVTTFALSRGSLRLAREKVVVKRLSAVEDLGDIEILCTDKTGTLTENKLVLDNIYSSDKEKCLLYGILASSCVEEEIESADNPFDSAIFKYVSPNIMETIKKFKVISEIPFDPFRLRNSALLEDSEDGKILIVRGSPEAVFKLSSNFENGYSKETVSKEIEKEGIEGKRVLALAYKKINENEPLENKMPEEKNLTFLGYFSFKDPLKESTKESIKLAKDLGVKIKILTGDSKEVAGAVAKEIGLIEDYRKVILGETLNSLTEKEFHNACEEFSVFARLSPTTKFKIVESLQKKFEVGFLGEGINDVPSLKLANVGIVVKDAADVSKDAADVILLNKDLRVIIEGVRQGRNIFSNINKYIKCTLASNIGNFYSMAIVSLTIPFLPMLPMQILLVNLLSDFPLIAIASDSIDAQELKQPKLYQLNKMIPLIILLAVISSIFDFIFFGVFKNSEPAALQTLWFVFSIFTEISLIFSIRSRGFFLKAKRPELSLIAISFLTFFITIFLPFTDFGRNFFQFVNPPVISILIVLFLVFDYFIISETGKLIYFRYFRKEENRPPAQ